MTGAPGDVWLMDLRVLHNGSPNASGRPRMMAMHRFMPNDLVPEVEQGFGWLKDAAQPT